MDPSGGPRWWRRRHWPLIAVAVVLVGAGVALAVYFAFVKRQGNVSHPNVEFTPTTPQKPKLVAETFKWPLYGYTPDRARYLNADIRPPYREIWEYKAGSLIEFQPILVNGVLYVVPNNGEARAIDAKTGKKLWAHHVGSLNASSPAWANNRLFITTLSGTFTCLNAKNGKRIWRRHLPSRSESSPLVLNGLVYFGSENGTVYALKQANGGKVWTYHAGGAVKGGIAYSKGLLYFGDYNGEVTALRAKDGKRMWRTGTSGAAFQQSGQFYSTPAVANGRVYLGNTDHFVYSFAAHTGQLAWRYSTGYYVYSAAAVGPGPGGKPTVFIGSYDRTFYAFDARSGKVRWTFNAPGRISGAPTLVGHVVYFSDLDSKQTTGLDARTGHPVFRFHSGKFNPVISDGRRIYLTGFSTVYTLVHASKPGRLPKKPKRKPAPHHKKPAKKHR